MTDPRNANTMALLQHQLIGSNTVQEVFALLPIAAYSFISKESLGKNSFPCKQTSIITDYITTFCNVTRRITEEYKFP